jgi:hypothetical protein
MFNEHNDAGKFGERAALGEELGAVKAAMQSVLPPAVTP